MSGVINLFKEFKKYSRECGSLKASADSIFRKTSVWIFIAFLLLAAGMGLKGQLESREMTGKAERQLEGGSSRSQTFTYQIDGSEEGELTLDIFPVERTQDEALELLERAAAQWEEVYLGENRSADEVRYDLNFPAVLCDGLVKISCESSNYSILQNDGKIIQDALTEDGELVELTVTFSYGEYDRIERYSLYILMPEAESAEWLKIRLSEEAQRTEQSSRNEKSFSLPDSIAGHTVSWEQKHDFQWIFIIFLGITAVFCLEWKEKESEKKRQKERNKQLMFEYPQMVDQLSILLDSGMTIRRAWERMLQTDQRMKPGKSRNRHTGRKIFPKYSRGRNQCKNQRIFVEEMWITYREIKEGRGEGEAYERFGNRIGLMPYRRLGSILSRNLTKGTGDIKLLLRKEAEEALEMRKNRARRMGEEAGTKMLFPMLVMLVLILMILLLPAITNF